MELVINCKIKSIHENTNNWVHVYCTCIYKQQLDSGDYTRFNIIECNYCIILYHPNDWFYSLYQ